MDPIAEKLASYNWSYAEKTLLHSRSSHGGLLPWVDSGACQRGRTALASG